MPGIFVHEKTPGNTKDSLKRKKKKKKKACILNTYIIKISYRSKSKLCILLLSPMKGPFRARKISLTSQWVSEA